MDHTSMIVRPNGSTRAGLMNTPCERPKHVKFLEGAEITVQDRNFQVLYLGLGGEAVDMRHVCLLVVLWIGHLAVEVVPVNELQHRREHRATAAGHVIDVIPVPQNQCLQPFSVEKNGQRP
jgi:hypothetical protein